MSTNSTLGPDHLARCGSSRPGRRGAASGSGATPTVVSVVVNGWGATGTCAPVRALNSDDLPALGRPTSPRRSTTCSTLPGDAGRTPVGCSRLMSKRTVKRKMRKKKKANHGKRPNAGRG